MSHIDLRVKINSPGRGILAFTELLGELVKQEDSDVTGLTVSEVVTKDGEVIQCRVLIDLQDDHKCAIG